MSKAKLARRLGAKIAVPDAETVADELVRMVAIDYLIDGATVRALAKKHQAAETLYVNAVLTCDCGRKHRLRFGPEE